MHEQCQYARHGVCLSRARSAGDHCRPLCRRQCRGHALAVRGHRWIARVIDEQLVQQRRDLFGVHVLGREFAAVEDVPNHLLLQIVSVEIQQLALVCVDQSKGFEGTAISTGDQRAGPQSRENLTQFGPR